LPTADTKRVRHLFPWATFHIEPKEDGIGPTLNRPNRNVVAGIERLDRIQQDSPQFLGARSRDQRLRRYQTLGRWGRNSPACPIACTLSRDRTSRFFRIIGQIPTGPMICPTGLARWPGSNP
jgi:hypothetical protein